MWDKGNRWEAGLERRESGKRRKKWNMRLCAMRSQLQRRKSHKLLVEVCEGAL